MFYFKLIVEDTNGEKGVKLPAGDAVLYPGSSLHRVTPVTRGTRLASFFWTQSLVRADQQRRMLFELDCAIQLLLLLLLLLLLQQQQQQLLLLLPPLLLLLLLLLQQ